MFNVGDVVKIRDDLSQENKYQLYVSYKMTEYAGYTARIKRIFPSDTFKNKFPDYIHLFDFPCKAYELDLDGINSFTIWSDDMLEKVNDFSNVEYEAEELNYLYGI